MKISLVSNYFNHHQKFLSDALMKRSDYSFISTTEMRKEREQLGYGIKEDTYVKKMSIVPKECKRIIDQADAVIFGSAPEELIYYRKKKKKLIFRYSERPLKKGMELFKYPYRFISWHKKSPMNKPIYMLCASAFTASDYSKFRMFLNRTYKWGYFPETKRYEDYHYLIEKKKKNIILWCGRFLNWKHPDDAIKVVNRLKKDRIEFELHFIGTGEMEDYLHKMVDDYHLNDYISFLGAMKPDQVRQHMEDSGIYLFTSDKYEGWGAVLNEAMNSGCAVVASHEIGSVPFLLNHNENGIVYKNGDVDDLYYKIKYLLDNPNEQNRLGENAYHTITDLWNADIAAERFLKLVEKINECGQCDLFSDGPCSRADILEDNWFEGAE